MKNLARLIAVGLALAALSGCVVNPVTGKSQISLMSPEQEIATGAQNYEPSQQSQGGQYTVDPALTTYVQSVGRKLAAVSDRPSLPYEFVVLNNDVPNAWAMPGGKLAINRGLLMYLEDEAQLAAVLGHEIVHAAARHGAQQQTQNVLLGAGVLLTGVAISQKKPEYGALAIGALGVGATAWQAKYGRNHELESDRVGIKYMAEAGYDAQAAVELQQIFVKLSEGRNAGFIDGLFASHPPSQERVDANRKTAAQYPGGVRNKTQYQRAIAQLVKDKPAYEKYQKAQQLAANKQYIDALAYADQAARAQPKENLFWELKGQLLLQQNKRDEAVVALDKAIQANPAYFKPYVFRGIAYNQLGKRDLAEKDLLTSQRYLPTQIATYYLGEIALAKGNRSQATEYFQQAAQGGGEIGEAAQAQLGKM
ncbi:M48 family metalloprotease [Cellvibrio japonicus]|uniref:Peptidase family M48 family n=1 Tax=Cellvibrio japonicus (strain Ueda107) TaxID=498211 RepID=B3PGD9_CELJU|nr:M48 family metalloprotease [Cellvibrio japonicus]ACE83057.1 Peptidase family M48 family [Cellvibrio japonicus Ueda107]QEI10931.1 M48 family metalloprotease [Cellvibrio japonicus]QEI14507.1 M48 family metalloprotease [Cellvibrio japonicus]QEI18085.1 M48 family metalloprotease [Cellvibrio japonicus]